MNDIIFVITGADHINNITDVLKRERYVEYMLSLTKLFSYNYPTFGVLSEINQEHIKDTPPFEKFPFKILKKIYSGELNGYNKSSREFISISSLLDQMNTIDINDNTFVVKASGRYLIINDSFINIVKKNCSNTEIVSIILSVCNDTQQATFLYAIRYKYFKKFYSQDVSILNKEGIEKVIFEFLIKNDLMKNTIKVNKLDVLVNIDNSGFGMY